MKIKATSYDGFPVVGIGRTLAGRLAGYRSSTAISGTFSGLPLEGALSLFSLKKSFQVVWVASYATHMRLMCAIRMRLIWVPDQPVHIAAPLNVSYIRQLWQLQIEPEITSCQIGPDTLLTRFSLGDTQISGALYYFGWMKVSQLESWATLLASCFWGR